MEQVEFTPMGIAKKEHELYGLDDDQLAEEAHQLRVDIFSWSQRNFKLSDIQIEWLQLQDDSFYVDFANDVAGALESRWDIDFLNEGPPAESWKSKRLDARQNAPAKRLTIWVHRIDEK